MTATLTFNLPEEEQEFRAAVDGHKFRAAIESADETLRMNIKHGAQDELYIAGLQAARDILSQACASRGVEVRE